MTCRTTCKRFLLITVVIAAVALLLLAASASAQDNVPYFCNGTDNSGGTCTVFQLDGSTASPANADTCVGTENGCPNEQNPVWPADWDALLYPSLTSGTVSVISGAAPGAYTFSLPWNSFGSFSGIIPSTLVTTGTSTILKQGSKNSNDISTWVVASQASPPKDAYLAGAIASYIGPPGTFYAGHELLYLGSTRFSPNGSATVGIWFFQQNVAVCQSGPSAGKALCLNGTSTLAEHQNGDLFLFLTFSGSGHATIQAATWNGTGTSGSLGTAVSLVTCPTANSDGCAVTNEASSIILGSSSGPQLPGTGFNVSGPGFAGFGNGIVPPLQFQETGVDLNPIFNGIAPCFSSVMFASVTSGSSPSTASMKSILLGSFNTCAITASKQCAAGTANIATGTVTYPISGTIENTGGGATSGLTLTDTFQNASQAFDTGSLSCTCDNSGCTITNSDCSTVNLDPGGKVDYSAKITTTQNGGSDVVHATMGGAGGGSASADSNTATCNALSFNTGVSITKNCDPGATLVAKNGLVAVQVTVDGVVTNNNAGGLPLTNVTVYDCGGASFAPLSNTSCPTTDPTSCTTNGGTLRTLPGLGTIQATTGNNTAPWSDTYNPSVAPSCGPYNFNDQVLVKGTCSSGFCACPTVENVKNQTCPLCPGPNCP